MPNSDPRTSSTLADEPPAAAWPGQFRRRSRRAAATATHHPPAGFPGDDLDEERLRAMTRSWQHRRCASTRASSTSPSPTGRCITASASAHAVAIRDGRCRPSVAEPAPEPCPFRSRYPWPSKPEPPTSRWRKSVGRSLRLHAQQRTAARHRSVDRALDRRRLLPIATLPAISVACRPGPDRNGPPGLAAVAAYAGPISAAAGGRPASLAA